MKAKTVLPALFVLAAKALSGQQSSWISSELPPQYSELASSITPSAAGTPANPTFPKEEESSSKTLALLQAHDAPGIVQVLSIRHTLNFNEGVAYTPGQLTAGVGRVVKASPELDGSPVTADCTNQMMKLEVTHGKTGRKSFIQISEAKGSFPPAIMLVDKHGGDEGNVASVDRLKETPKIRVTVMLPKDKTVLAETCSMNASGAIDPKSCADGTEMVDPSTLWFMANSVQDTCTVLTSRLSSPGILKNQPDEVDNKGRPVAPSASEIKAFRKSISEYNKRRAARDNTSAFELLAGIRKNLGLGKPKRPDRADRGAKGKSVQTNQSAILASAESTVVPR